jgi:very-short-patch-repair endonuclease
VVASIRHPPPVPSRPVRSRLTAPVTRTAAAASGISEWQLRHRDVVRLSRDTYVPRALVRELPVRIAAVLLTAPSNAVVSHLTAAALWGVEVPMQRQDDARVHLTVATGSAVRGRADRVIHRSPLEPGEVTSRVGFTLTTPERTWRDLAAVLVPPALLAVTDQLLQHWCTTDDLARQLDLRPRGRGSARARSVLPLGDRRAGSPMESVLRWLLHAAGLPAPDLQHVIRTPGGVFIGAVDMAWRDRKVLVEFDGNYHRDRKVFVEDLRRQNRLVAEGWTILRFTSADVYGRPDEVVAAIRRALGL